MNPQNKLTVVVEENDGLYEGYIEGVNSKTLISSAAPNIDELLDNLRMLIKSYQQHEGAHDTAWAMINADEVELGCRLN